MEEERTGERTRGRRALHGRHGGGEWNRFLGTEQPALPRLRRERTSFGITRPLGTSVNLTDTRGVSPCGVPDATLVESQQLWKVAS